jgi:hypothetical protein
LFLTELVEVVARELAALEAHGLDSETLPFQPLTEQPDV